MNEENVFETSEELAIIVADYVKDSTTVNNAFKTLYERLLYLETLYCKMKEPTIRNKPINSSKCICQDRKQ